MDVARGDILALAAEERRVVDGEKHTHRRLVYRYRGQRLRVLVVADGVPNLEIVYASQGADVTRADCGSLGAAESLEDLQLLDLGLDERAVALGERHVHALGQRPAMHAADGDAPRVGRVVERRDEHLRRALQTLRGGDVFDDCIEQRRDVVGRLAPVVAHPVVLGRTVDDGEIQLVLRRVEREHEVKNHLVHLLRPAVGLVHLVDDDDRFQTYLQRLLQDEACLRHRPLECIDQQQASVSHVEHPLDLATEVRVARRVDDVDFRPFVID